MSEVTQLGLPINYNSPMDYYKPYYGSTLTPNGGLPTNSNWWDSLQNWGKTGSGYLGKIGGVAGDIFNLYQGIQGILGKDPYSQYVDLAKQMANWNMRTQEQHYQDYLAQHRARVEDVNRAKNSFAPGSGQITV